MPSSQSIEEELARLTAAGLWAQRGSLISCVMLQMLPDYSPEIGELAHGTVGYPFWSVSTVIPEQTKEQDSFGTLCRKVRTVTCVLVADRKVVQTPATMWAYKGLQENCHRALNKSRPVGQFVSDPNSCLHYGIVRPRSVVESASWFRSQKFVAAFDVVYTTDESPTP